MPVFNYYKHPGGERAVRIARAKQQQATRKRLINNANLLKMQTRAQRIQRAAKQQAAWHANNLAKNRALFHSWPPKSNMNNKNVAFTQGTVKPHNPDIHDKWYWYTREQATARQPKVDRKARRRQLQEAWHTINWTRDNPRNPQAYQRALMHLDSIHKRYRAGKKMKFAKILQ